ncbi:MAG: acetoacetate decarboxylase [Rhodospirillales bacterium]|nr:acetoacetate decarboxylase [Rhodospirillales bacterium]
MKKADVLRLASMPLQSPTYPRGPYRFFNRQYLVINYRTDAAAAREALPEPLELDGDTVSVQWLDLPDGEGFGAYAATAQIIPCRLKGERCSFVSQMYVDNSSPLAGGREIWGYPMKHGKAALTVNGDTLTGTLHYAREHVATGTMVYKHDAFRQDHAAEQALLERTQITLKVIPGVDGKPAIAQLVATKFTDVTLKGAWSGSARLELIPAVNCPLADLPVRQVTQGLHMVTDMTLPYGRVVHDYLG